MANVKQLPNSTSRLLCSGQIITSVFCVVKELVENSVDSGCSSIDIKLENYGLDRIEVRDNGCGIHSSDIPDVVKPHYTSKISSFADLETLKTFGFRGEALGALCSVADVTICSKASDEDMSQTCVFNSSGEVLTSKPSAYPQGTIVIAANLFKKIPVRRQIYKTEKMKKEEIKKIESLLCAFACSELGVRFALHHNRNVIWQKSAVNDLRSAVIQVYGSSAVNNMVPLCSYDETLEVRLDGFFPKPGASISSMSQSNNDRTIVVVNRRPVRMKELDKVLLEWYLRSSDFSGCKNRYPLCFLSISVPSCKVDVNVEPNKTRVLLHSLEEIKYLISDSLGKLYQPVSPSKQTTESSATNQELMKDCLLTDSELCTENTNLLGSEKSVRESNSGVLLRSSASVDICGSRYELTNNSKQDVLNITSYIRSDVQLQSEKQDYVPQNKHVNTKTCNTEKEFNLLSGSICDIQKNTGNQRAVSKICSNLLSRSSSLINSACYTKYESSNNSCGKNVLEISQHAGNCVEDHARLQDNVLKDLPGSSKHAANIDISNSAEKEFSFLFENVSNGPKDAGCQQTYSKISITTENSGNNQTECLPNSLLSENVQTILQPHITKSNCSLNNVPPVNINNLLSGSGNLSAVKANLNDRIQKNFLDDSLYSTTEDAMAFSHPLFPKTNISVARKTAGNSLNVCKSNTHCVRSGNSSVKKDESDHQSGLILLKNVENAQTFIIPCNSESSSSNVNPLMNKCSSFEQVNTNQKINSRSEKIQELYPNSSIVSKPANSPVKSGTNELHSDSTAMQKTEKALNSTLKDGNNELQDIKTAPQGNVKWSMGNLLDTHGKKLEPVAILTKSPLKRTVQEDFVPDVKRKKCDAKDTSDLSEAQEKQLAKKNLNAFGLFCREFRLEVALLNPGCSNQDVARILTEKWNNLPSHKKAAYENKVLESGLSKRKVKKKLGTTLSQTLDTMTKSMKKLASKNICDQDQELIRKRKTTVVQFNVEDLKAKNTQNPSRCYDEMKNEYSLINCVSPGSWICLKGCELLLLNSFRLREVLIYRRLMDTYVFPSEKLNPPVALNESMISDDGLWQVLFELVRCSDVLHGTFVADKRITSNGFRIRIEKDGHSATLTEMPLCLPFCGVSDLTEILRHLKHAKESATLRDCRPAKAIHYLQGEAVRIVRQSPGKLRKDEVENLLKQRKNVLSQSSSVCIHNKPFFHLLYNMNALQQEETEVQDF